MGGLARRGVKTVALRPGLLFLKLNYRVGQRTIEAQEW